MFPYLTEFCSSPMDIIEVVNEKQIELVFVIQQHSQLDLFTVLLT